MSGPCLHYEDTVTLVTTIPGNYGDGQIIEEQAEVPAIIEQNTGFEHGSNQDAILSDMVVYVDPTNEFVSDNYYRLEEMLVIAPLYGVPSGRAWFQVVSATVARDHLLTNSIDNVRLQLKKTTEIFNVS